MCRRTWYSLWFVWFLFGLGYLPGYSFSLTLDLRLVRDCDHWFVLMCVMWEMTWLFLYLFPLLVVENLGECWRLLMRVVLASYWYMYCGCPWNYMDSLSLRCCEWIGYRFDIIFCSGSFLVYMWQVLLLRLEITGYKIDMLMMWDSLGIPLEVWIVGWFWHLLWMLFQLWIFLQQQIHVITFGSGFCAWHFSWYIILWSSNVTGWVAFSLDGFYVCLVIVA